MAPARWAWRVSLWACFLLGVQALGPATPQEPSVLRANTVQTQPAWRDSASTLMCVHTRTPRRPSSDTSISMRTDPRYTLLSNDLLLCEIPSNSEGIGQPRMYALLGTVVVPGEMQLPGHTTAVPGDVARPAIDDGQTSTRDDAAQDGLHGGGDPLLSFDEWKEQHLESVRKSRKLERERKHEGPINETHTEEPSTTPSASPTPHVAPNTTLPVAEQVLLHAMATEPEPPVIHAFEDASAQLAELKHRWNYASLDCAAVLHQANPSAKFPSAILSEKKDRYMLSPCPHARQGEEAAFERQFVIVELCQQIRIDTLVLANLEFFSSIFKVFTVRVSRTLDAPETEWKSLGLFRARNVRGPQVFKLDTPPASYYRFLRINFLEHYGNEYYCPISLLRVYGRNEREDADEDVLDELQAMEDDDADSDEVNETIEAPMEQPVAPRATAERVCVVELFPGVVPPQCGLASDPSPLTASAAPTRATPLSSMPSAATSTPEPPRPGPTGASQGGTLASGESAEQSTAATRPSANSTDEDVRKSADPRGKAPKADKTKGSETKPAGSESIYRTITKRLSALEANTSLSMQFLQLNSERMRDKMTQLEHVQETRLGELLAALNATQTQRMDDHMAQYHLALQHALATIETQRRRVEAERTVLLARMERLATEMRTEKRWSAAQLLLLLLVLLITALTHGSREVQRADGAPWRIALPPREMPPLFQTPMSPPAADEDPEEVEERMAGATRDTTPAGPTPRPVASLKFPRRTWSATPSPVRLRRERRQRMAIQRTSISQPRPRRGSVSSRDDSA